MAMLSGIQKNNPKSSNPEKFERVTGVNKYWISKSNEYVRPHGISIKKLLMYS